MRFVWLQCICWMLELYGIWISVECILRPELSASAMRIKYSERCNIAFNQHHMCYAYSYTWDEVQIIIIVPLQLALVVAQSQDHNWELSPINLTALSDGLRRVAIQAKKWKGWYLVPCLHLHNVICIVRTACT